jgi:hypothetical protein
VTLRNDSMAVMVAETFIKAGEEVCTRVESPLMLVESRAYD